MTAISVRQLFVSATRRLLNPFPVILLPLGSLMSGLDAVAERESLKTVEETYRAAPGLDRIGHAFTRFLDDPDAVLALKKNFHIALENRMRVIALRADPPERNGLAPIAVPAPKHPLDEFAHRVLERAAGTLPAAPRTSMSARARHLLGVMTQGVALVGGAVTVLLRHGTGAVRPRRYRVGSLDQNNEEYWGSVLRALSDQGLGGDDALLFIDESNTGFQPGNGLGLADPAKLPVERGRWWREVVAPSFGLVASTLWTAFRFLASPAVVEVANGCLFEARRSLMVRRVAQNFHFGVYLDVGEYTATHIIKRIVFSKQGTRLVRWPHCLLDNPGATVSYLGYDLFLGGGTYETNFAHSWSKKLRHQAVGLFRNDRRFADESPPIREVEERISRHIAKGGRLLVWFGPSAIPGMAPIIPGSLGAATEAILPHDDWLLVVKSKGFGGYRAHYELVMSTPGVSELERRGRLLMVPYTVPRVEVCPSGWLIGRMDAGIGNGSIQQEGLTQGKPVFSYYPVIQDTPYQRMLKEARLAHDDPAGMASALGDWLQDPDRLRIPYGWFRENFDPFGDDQALTRIVDLLWGNGLESLMDEAQPSTDRITL